MLTHTQLHTDTHIYAQAQKQNTKSTQIIECGSFIFFINNASIFLDFMLHM